MFRRKRLILNGIELPREFSDGSRVNDIAISKDGTQYARIFNDSLKIEKMPDDGCLKIGGMTIQYSRYGGISASSRGGTSVCSISGGGSIGSIRIGGSRRGGILMQNVSGSGSGLEYEIDELYQLCEGDKFVYSTPNDTIKLKLRDGDKCRVKGDIASRPEYSNGQLSIGQFEGKLELPTGISALELALSSSNGSIKGDIAHPGNLKIMNGSIKLDLYSPLKVIATTINGRVKVKGMKKEGRAYVPENAAVQGVLILSTMNGSVKVNYLG